MALTKVGKEGITGISNSSDATAITIDSSENVGIGTSTVDSALHIEQNASGVTETSGSTLKIHNTNASGRSKISLHNNAETASGSIYYDTDSGMLALQGDTGAGVVIQTSGNNERVRVNTNGNIGIGTGTITDTSNYRNIHIEGTTGTIMRFMADGTQVGQIQSDTNEFQLNAVTSDPMVFKTNNTERLRVDASGNVLVGTTDAAPRNLSSGTGIRLGNDGSIEAAKATDPPGRFNRTGNDGEVIQIRRDGTSRGRFGIKSTYPYIGEEGTGLLFEHDSSVIEPFNVGTASARDDAIDLGGASVRFDDIRATNGTIQTSDQNDKQQIASLTSTEIAAAKAISALFKTYKWNKSVTANGDAARTHTGVIAQEVQAAMSAVGLDATKYAFWCSDTWWEHSVDVAAVEDDEEAGIEAKDAYTRIDIYKTSEEAPTGATERTRLGIRYPELLAFVGAATEQRLADIETRLTALEGS